MWNPTSLLLWARRRVRWGRPARPGSGSVRPGGGRIGSFCWDVLPPVGQGWPGDLLLLLLLPPPAATTTNLSADRKVMGVEVLSKLKDNKKKDKLCQSVNPSDKSSQDLLKTKIFSFKNILLFISMVLSHNSYRHRRGRREYFLHHQ